MVAVWCLIGGILTVGGLGLFFSFIFEFVEHHFFLSEEALVLGIVMFLVGFYVMSRVLRAAHWAGLDDDLSIAWAPVHCPGYVCHMCCTSRKERKRFLETKCGRSPANSIDRWCCCFLLDSDRSTPEVAWNRVFANEDEWEEDVQLRAAEEDARQQIRVSMQYRTTNENLLAEDSSEYDQDDDVVLDIEENGGDVPGEIEMIAMMMGERKERKQRKKEHHHKKYHHKDRRKKKKKDKIKWEFQNNLEQDDVVSSWVEKESEKPKKRRSRKKSSKSKKKKKSHNQRLAELAMQENVIHPKTP